MRDKINKMPLHLRQLSIRLLIGKNTHNTIAEIRHCRKMRRVMKQGEKRKKNEREGDDDEREEKVSNFSYILTYFMLI